MRVREVDVRFADGIDRRRVVTLGDALAGVLADAGTAELVSLAVSGSDLATFAFAAVPTGPAALPTPSVGPPAEPGQPARPEPSGDVPAAEDCREAVLAAAELSGAGRVEVVADRVGEPGAPAAGDGSGPA